MNHEVEVPRGMLVWMFAVLQAIAGAGVLALALAHTEPEGLSVVAVAGVLTLAWTWVRPEGLGTLLLPVITGVWIATGWGAPSAGVTLAMALLLLSGHHWAAVRSGLPLTARVAWRHAGRIVAAQVALLAGGAALSVLLMGTAGAGGSGPWRIIWPALAFIALVALVAWFNWPRRGHTGTKRIGRALRP